jgi:acyl-CoA synthetase (AMP-forming)/AMP-acid ligase II
MAGKGEVRPLILSALINNAWDKFPQHKALIVSGKFEVTYAELQRLVNRCAAKLRNAGIGTGDVVALTFPNSIEVKFHAMFSFLRVLGCLRANARSLLYDLPGYFMR